MLRLPLGLTGVATASPISKINTFSSDLEIHRKDSLRLVFDIIYAIEKEIMYFFLTSLCIDNQKRRNNQNEKIIFAFIQEPTN